MTRPRFGQHFLIDHAVVQRHLSYASLCSDDVVLEVGPGTGVLTIPLAEQVKKVIAVEIDGALCQELRKKLPVNVHLIYGDILKLEWSELPVFTKVIANLPYEISSPFTFRLLEYPFRLAVLMFQQDFARRMVAQPYTKEYSRLSVALYYKTQCSLLETIPHTSFSPPPRVTSSLIKIIPRETPAFSVKDERMFFNVVKLVFLHRRKTIKNALSSLLGEKVSQVSFASCRAEELTPEQLGQLSDEVYELTSPR